jgi:hypothetical protein
VSRRYTLCPRLSFLVRRKTILAGYPGYEDAVLFLVSAFLRRFVNDISDLFDAGCRHKIGIADGEVTKIRSIAVKAIQ